MKIILDIPDSTQALTLMLAVLGYNEEADAPKLDVIATTIQHPKNENTYEIISPYEEGK